jgi:hypothetical protein
MHACSAIAQQICNGWHAANLTACYTMGSEEGPALMTHLSLRLPASGLQLQSAYKCTTHYGYTHMRRLTGLHGRLQQCEEIAYLLHRLNTRFLS